MKPGSRLVAAVAGALLLAFPATMPAYILLGFTLPITKRDFRIFNSFADPQSNDNTIPHPNFPGATGAAMAVWKAAVEWGSRLHGPGGAGDPTQAGLGGNPLLGPGEPEAMANFDFHFQGLAAGPGALDDNVVFATPFSLGAGVLSLTLAPDANGWQILFDDSQWIWEDGPGVVTCGSNLFDLQGIATHQFGHALGLGHSFLPGTMQPIASCPNSIDMRSIEPDDRNGVRAAYGDASLASSTKPVITSISGTFALGGAITIAGSNFDPSSNEVWFTSDNGGQPRIVGGLPSSGGGTQILTTIPADAPLPRSGDLLVRVPGTGHDRLSNAWPIDIPPPPATPPTLVSVAPNPINLAALPQPVLTLSGTSLSQVTSVQVGSVQLFPPFATQSESTIQAPLPLLPGTGPTNVQVTNPFGTSNVLPLLVEPADPPVLLTSPAVGGTGVTFTANMFTLPGQVVVLTFSPSSAPSSVPGVVDLGLGSNFSLLFLFPPLVASAANGSAQVSFPIPFGGAGSTFYWQFASIPPTLSVPLPVSNLASILVFF